MILNFKGKKEDYPEHLITINNIPIENVTEFIYLGATITYNEPGTSEKELDRRIGSANRKFAEYKKLLCNYHLKLGIRIKFYNAYVRSRLCYCCETWTLTQSQFDKVERAHIQFMRRMVRDGLARMSSKKEIELAKSENDMERINWAWKYTNEKILQITKSVSTKEYIKLKNNKWIAHIARASNDTLTKRLMFVDEKYTKRGNHNKTVLENVIVQVAEKGKSIETFLRECTKR